MTRKPLLALWLVLSATVLFAVAGDGQWIARVPSKERNRPNPLAGNATAALAGARLFNQNCASCHGDDARGRDKHPGLRSERVRTASPGELQWLLTNGSMKNGMPSWSRLPEPQRWQLVSYLKSLE